MNHITLPTNAILDKLGPDGRNWIKGAYRDEDGAMCLHGAIRRCQPVPGDAYLIERVAERQGWGPLFNDAPDTTWADVRAVIGKHREVTDNDLEATFGPSWRWVVPVVRQAATMTPGQGERLAAGQAVEDVALHAAYTARVAAWVPAGHATGEAAAARDAAWAARVAAWVAGGAAARAAAWGAVAEATADAAVAVASRHLVGQHGFTQQHWDTLTAPWVSVFGPLEPLADPGSDQ